jgi:hypothetical protein
MTLEEVRSAAPAAFSPIPAPHCGPRYSHVTTASVLEKLQQDGWDIASAGQGRTLVRVSHNDLADASGQASHRRLHRSHEVRLFHSDFPEVAGVRPQVIVGNSSDHTSAFHLQAGLFRSFCFNGLVVGSRIAGLSVYHRGQALEAQVLEAAEALRGQFGRALEVVDHWRQVKLVQPERIALALSGARLRWPDAELSVSTDDLLAVRRPEDRGDDLWSVFNRVQEAVLRGGFPVYSPDHTSRIARKLTSLPASRRLNVGLWEAAESFAN